MRRLTSRSNQDASPTALRTVRPRRLAWFVRPQAEMATVFMQIKVKPKARASSLAQAADGTWLAKLKSPPVDGKANKDLIALVAEHFQCRKAAVSIKSGASGRMKLVKVEAS